MRSSAGPAPAAQTAPTDVAAAPVVNGKPMAYALFAGGCFWCIEADFEKLAGVLAVESGYTAGQTPQPTYEQVSAGHTGHTEAVRVLYDPSQVSYAQLVDYFWRHIDPTVKDRQFCDVGSQYRSGIYWQNEAERAIAEASNRDSERTTAPLKIADGAVVLDTSNHTIESGVDAAIDGFHVFGGGALAQTMWPPRQAPRLPAG